MTADQLGGVLLQYVRAPRQQLFPTITSDFRAAAGAASQAQLASGLATVLQADVVAELFRYSDVHQRVGFLQMLIAHLGQELMAVIANAGVLGLPLNALAVTPETAMQLAPDAIAFLATEAAQHDSSMIDQIAAFYARYPDIMEHLRAGVLVQVMRRLAYQWARDNVRPT